MGKNYKEKASYIYLHEIKYIPRKMLITLKKKWNRANFDTAEFKYSRICKKQEIFDREFENELKNK